jgi:hypothetical protein
VARYWVYGLCLASDEPLDGLTPAPADALPDVWVQLHGECGAFDDSAPWQRIHASLPDEYAWVAWAAPSMECPDVRLRYGNRTDHTQFLIDPSGSRIRVRRTAASTIADVEALLLGLVLTCVLRIRGLTCLHASVVAIGNQAVVLMGRTGAGKSTTAAGLFRIGARPLADDLAAVIETEQGFMVHPGPRRLRLRSDVAELMSPDAGLPRVWPDLPDRPTRRYLSLADDDTRERAPEPVPLAAVYALGVDPRVGQVTIKPLSPSRALLVLLAQSSADFLLGAEGREREFDRLARLVRAVPVRVLLRERNLEDLDGLCRAILEDATGLPSRRRHASA